MIIHTSVKDHRGFGYDDKTSFLVPFETNLNDVSPATYSGTALGAGVRSNTQAKIGDWSFYTPSSTDGVDYGDIPLDITDQDFCVEAWVYHTASPAAAAITAKYSISSGWMFRSNSRAPAFYGYGSGTIQIVGSFGVPANEWAHMAVSRRDNELWLWANGRLSGYTSSCLLNCTATSDPVRIGEQNGWPTRGFVGYIDTARVTIGHHRYAGGFHPFERYF